MLGSAIALVVLGLFCFSCATQRSLRRYIADMERDPLTGVALGVEATTLRPATPDPATSGTACLMIHGFLSARTDFSDLGERLVKRGMTVRMMRLPGHGTTPVDFAYLPEGELFRAVHKEYEALRTEFDTIYVMGFSMGGTLTTLLASREPVDRIVLVAPYYRVTHQWYYLLPAEAWHWVAGRLIPYVKRPMGFIKLNDRTHADEIFMYRIMPNAGVRQLLRLGKQVRRKEVLEKVTCPTLLVHSVNDEASSPKAARRALETFSSRQKRSRWFERSNHILLWDYDCEEAKGEIERFLMSPEADLESGEEGAGP